MRRLLFVALLFTSAASAYIRLPGVTAGLYQHRIDYTNIQFLLNQQAVPGLANADGKTWITADSDVFGAVAGALNAWSSVPGSAVTFAQVQSTTLANDTSDAKHVIVFLDTPAIRSVLGPNVLALTSSVYTVNDGTLVDTDIMFNPVTAYSTTGAAGTYDVQSVLTHELGHALGANHTSILGATMYQYSLPSAVTQRSLSADDKAFAAGVYPGPGDSPFGTITGTLTLNGAPVHSALMTAFDTLSGVAVSGLSSPVDGTFSIKAPPGSYLLYAEPLSGNIQAGNLYLTSDSSVDTGFQPSLSGGGDTPAILNVTAGATVAADFSPSGTSGLKLQFINTGGAGALADQSTLYNSAAPLTLVSGTSFDLILVGQGIDTSFTDANVRLMGPMALRAGSVRPDNYATDTGLRFIRMTVDSSVVNAPVTASFLIMKSGSVAAYTGGLILTPPPVKADAPTDVDQ